MISTPFRYVRASRRPSRIQPLQYFATPFRDLRPRPTPSAYPARPARAYTLRRPRMHNNLERATCDLLNLLGSACLKNLRMICHHHVGLPTFGFASEGFMRYIALPTADRFIDPACPRSPGCAVLLSSNRKLNKSCGPSFLCFVHDRHEDKRAGKPRSEHGSRALCKPPILPVPLLHLILHTLRRFFHCACSINIRVDYLPPPPHLYTPTSPLLQCPLDACSSPFTSKTHNSIRAGYGLPARPPVTPLGSCSTPFRWVALPRS